MSDGGGRVWRDFTGPRTTWLHVLSRPERPCDSGGEPEAATKRRTEEVSLRLPKPASHHNHNHKQVDTHTHNDTVTPDPLTETRPLSQRERKKGTASCDSVSFHHL